jgi:cell division protein FtsL
MVCSTCDAQVGADDPTCAACGAAQQRVLALPIAPVRVPDPDPGVGVGIGVGVSTPTIDGPPLGGGDRRQRVSRPLVVVVLVAVAAFIAAGVLAVSRSSVSGALATTRTQLKTSNGRLSDSQSQIHDLQHEVSDLQAASEAGRSKLADATSAKQDLQRSLSACQDLFRTLASYASRTPPPSVRAQVASQLVSCFQGHVPPSIFP